MEEKNNGLYKVSLILVCLAVLTLSWL